MRQMRNCTASSFLSHSLLLLNQAITCTTTGQLLYLPGTIWLGAKLSDTVRWRTGQVISLAISKFSISGDRFRAALRRARTARRSASQPFRKDGSRRTRRPRGQQRLLRVPGNGPYHPCQTRGWLWEPSLRLPDLPLKIK